MFFITSCGSDNGKNEMQENSDDYEENSYLIATLRINMPLTYDDLENYFEFSIIDKLEEENIGEVVGDGTPLGKFGPYATDIEIDIEKDKLDEFKNIIEEYRFPKGSYLIVDGEIDSEFGDLYGIRIISSDSYKNNLNVYESLKEYLSGKYCYCTLISLSGYDAIYFYGEDLKTLKDELNNYISLKELDDILSFSDMPDYIQE